MEIKSYKNPGFVSWANSKHHCQLLCCAPFEMNQNGLFSIDILSIDVLERSKELELLGSCFSQKAFRCIAWDTFGEKDSSLPYGLIFGGMEDGSMSFWNPAEAIRSKQFNASTVTAQNYDSQPSLVYEQDAEQNSFPIMCAQWNSLKPNYLAFGGESVLIVDIGKGISNPDVSKPGHKNPHEGSYITSVTWNKEVPHVLASASSNGLIALWDIKSNNSIFQFKDSPNTTVTTGRNVVICWSKNISTQIAVTLDDQKKSQLQIWDLRNQKGPVVVIDRGHNKGIKTMDWCETDPQLIITGGGDRKIMCWNYTQPENDPLMEMPNKEEIMQLKWCKKLPSIFSVTTSEKVSICTLNEGTTLNYVPKWYKVSNGTTILGSNTLLTYSETRGNTLHQYKLNIPKQSQLVQALDNLAATVNNEEVERENTDLWKVINAKNGKDSETQIYEFLSLDKSKIIREVEKYTGKKRESGIHANKLEKKSKQHQNAFIPVSGSDAFSFFQNIKNKSEPTKAQQDQEQPDKVEYEMVKRNPNWDTGRQRLIKQSILIGNYGGAIDSALKCGRTSQALIIAYSVGQEAFNNTLKTFFTETTDSFITDVLKPLAYRDTEQLVRKYEIQKWKECIALVLSITSDKRSFLLKSLANRIKEETGNIEAVIICLILAQDFNQISNIYLEHLNQKPNHSVKRKIAAVQLAQRLISIYNSFTTEAELNISFKKIIRQGAYVCIEEGRQKLAYDMMKNYSPGTRDIFMDYLSNVQGIQGAQFPKAIPLPYMKRAQNPRVNQNKPVNTKPSSGLGVQPPNRPKPPKAMAFQPANIRQDPHQVPDRQPPPPPHGQNRKSQPQNAPFAEEQEQTQPVQVQVPKKSNKQQPPPPPKSNANRPPPPLERQSNFNNEAISSPSAFNPNRSPPPTTQIQKLIPPPKKPISTPPPPPPKPQSKRQSTNQVRQQEQHYQQSYPQRQQHNQQQHNQQQQYYQQQNNQKQIQNKITPPPSKGGKKPPPPPMPKHQPEQQEQNQQNTQWGNNQQRNPNQYTNNQQSQYQNQNQAQQQNNQNQGQWSNNHNQGQRSNQHNQNQWQQPNNQNQNQNQGQWSNNQHDNNQQHGQNNQQGFSTNSNYQNSSEDRNEEPKQSKKSLPPPPVKKTVPPPPGRR